MGKPNVSPSKRKLFSLLFSGYRHVYLEGLTEASIFVHITINEIYGKVRKSIGLKVMCDNNMVLNKVIFLTNCFKGTYILTKFSSRKPVRSPASPVCQAVRSCPDPHMLLPLFWGMASLGLGENCYSLRSSFVYLLLVQQ